MRPAKPSANRNLQWVRKLPLLENVYLASVHLLHIRVPPPLPEQVLLPPHFFFSTSVVFCAVEPGEPTGLHQLFSVPSRRLIYCRQKLLRGAHGDPRLSHDGPRSEQAVIC
jgi:hypothetical protein